MKRLILLLLILALVPSIYASEPTSAFIPSVCTGVNAFEYGQLTQCQNHAELIRENYVMDGANKELIGELVSSKESMKEILQNTEEQAFIDLKGLSSVLTNSLLALIVIYTGYLFISSSTFPEKREQAKRQLKNLAIIALILVTLGFIVGLGITMSNSMVEVIEFKLNKQNVLETFTKVKTDLQTQSYEESLDLNSKLKANSPGFTSAARAYLISLQARNLLLTTLVILAPLIVLLYYWRPTKEFGKFFTTLFVIEVFIPSIFMLLLLGGVTLTNTSVPAGELPSYAVLTAALYLSAALHATLVLLAIIKSALGVMRG